MLLPTTVLLGLLSIFGLSHPTVDIPLSGKALLTRALQPISTDGSCGGPNLTTCTGSTFGTCCSSFGFCGNTPSHCATSFGCQFDFGVCSNTNISPDATCGGTTGYTCTGSTFGTCCSSSGFCGSTVGFCAQGCQKSAGTCTTGTVPSLTGECGATNGNYTCAGGPQNGKCCSSSGFCGTGASYCGTGCQLKYGKCT